MPTVVGEEMKMVPGNAECTRKTGGPQTDQSTFYFVESEFSLDLGDVDQSIVTALWRTDRAGPHVMESPVEPECVKDIVRRPVCIAACIETFERVCGRYIEINFRRKGCHHCERCGRVCWRLRDHSIALDSIDAPIENHHLPVKIRECAESEIAMLQD